MEIAGYPHYENACSNFLAFFFDPEGSHRLGNLFLDSLAELVSLAGAGEGLGGNVTVEREVGTTAGNRIDILMRSDSHAVLIENKIFAAVANPFEDYAEYLDGLTNESGDAYEDDNKIKILLTLYPSNEGYAFGFRNLTHAAFATAVRTALGRYVPGADTRYLTLLLDFLNTLDNLGEGTRMNQGFIKLLGERRGEVDDLLAGINQVRGEMRGKARDLGKLIDLEPFGKDVQQGDWRPTVALYHSLFHTVYKDGKEYVGIDTVISPSGWEIQIFPRPKVTRMEVEGLLNRLGIRFEDDRRFIHPRRFDYDADLRLVAEPVQEIVGKLSRSVG